MNLLKPDPSISYSVVLKMYLSCAVLFFFFYGLETYFTTLDDQHWLHENLAVIKGVWVIFVPFLPCVGWAGYMTWVQGKEEGGKKKEE
ncbi:hypothetical protein TL16_g10942 [Triparma laevis f. inornata]|uniref:Uncharacterized protein n=2 Tax=Triparma laevis TaxID=1534972 RepID=A0A9W7EAF2_9STRA|nr:hypothetical protein TrLO_g13 [Triparma laevis f. longispina]GMH87711.1 hypothetical protein TL16_g10942 [Triparma laevis f. inornata]